MSVKTTLDKTSNLKSSYTIPELPMSRDVETIAILKKTREARAALAELKGVAVSMPNQSILINTLSLQEAKDSSAIENIITTNDELYQSDIDLKQFTSVSAKEVHLYASALRSGYQLVKETKILTNNHIKQAQAEIEGNNAGFRSQSGTALKNDQTGEIVYTPPQSLNEIQNHMNNLESFINNSEACDWDVLVKMAVIHHQFESIHPFFDGNGRTGRILNILYLVKEGLLDTPVLYLSRYINHNKPQYYNLLQKTRDENEWEEWILFMLEGVRETSYQTIRLIEEIKRIMLKHKKLIRAANSNIYSQDLINAIFSHPYTKIVHLEKALRVSRPTATKYLNFLVELGLMRLLKIGRDNYYINQELMGCLESVRDI
jgi:Fic family protein